MIDLESVSALVQGFDVSADPAATKSRDLIQMLLSHTPDPFSRQQFNPGHITATGLVIAPDGERVLLVHHRRLDRWLLPGGHVEYDDPDIWHTARREVVEETGVLLAEQVPAILAGLDVHGIPAKHSEPYHLHHDLVFHFRAISDNFRLSHESRAIVWSSPADFDSYDVPLSVRLTYRRIVAVSAR
jgi:8-oxo-dGTP pyrophosphatase MutT (NUDIX family)